MKPSAAGVRTWRRKEEKAIHWASCLRSGHRNSMTHISQRPFGSHTGILKRNVSAKSFQLFSSLYHSHISYTPLA